MGAWGYGYRDNDAALDWLHGLEKDIRKTLRESDVPEEILIAIETTQRLELDEFQTVDDIQEGLMKISDEWLDNWDDPETIRAKIWNLKRKYGVISPLKNGS